MSNIQHTASRLPLLVRINPAAAYLGVSRSKLYELLGAGDLVARRIGGRTLILYADLEAYAKALPPASIGAQAKSGKTK